MIAALHDLGVRSTLMQGSEELASDPQVQTNDYVVEVEDPRLGRIRTPANPPRLSGGNAPTAAAAPSLGELRYTH